MSSILLPNRPGTHKVTLVTGALGSELQGEGVIRYSGQKDED